MLIRKEIWLFLSDKKSLAVTLIIPVTIIPAIVIPIFAGPRIYTSLTYSLALKQIKENYAIFGLTSDDVDRLGENAITFAAMFQLSPTIAIFTAIVAAQIVGRGFMIEKYNGTMEILLASPIEIEDIVIPKVVIGAMMGAITWSILFSVVTSSIEYITLKYIGKLWLPTAHYILLMVLLPLSFFLFGLSFSLLAGVRGSEALLNLSIYLVVIVSVCIMLTASILRLPAPLFFLLLELMSAISFLVSMFIIVISYRIMNRLAFIVNY